MFAALELIPYEKGLRACVRRRLHPPEPERQQVTVPAGAAFCLLRVPLGKRGIPWDMVRFAADRFAEKLLLPPGVNIPEGCGCKALVCTQYKQLLLLQTGISLLKQARLNPRILTVTLIDKQAHFVSMVRHLMPLAATVRVITQEPEFYRHIEEELLDDFGATVLLTDESGAAKNSDFVLALDTWAPVVAPAAVVFAHSEHWAHTISCFTVTGSTIVLPERYRAIFPKDMDEQQFAAALYEQCRAAPLGGLCYQKLFVNGTESSVSDIILQMRRALLNTECNKVQS